MVENLHGDKTKIEASFVKEYANSEENDTSLINAIESIFSTRLTEENYFGLINLMKTFSSNTSVHDIEKALVSHTMHSNVSHTKFEFFNFVL